MSATLAQDALIARLKAMPGRPTLAYPNGPQVSVLPRIVVDVPSASERAVGVSSITQGDAEIIARVETLDGQLDTEAKNIVQAIVDRFPVGLRTECVTITQAPTPRARYSADGVYHIPVIIRGRYHF